MSLRSRRIRFWRYDEIPEVSDRSCSDPQRDGALSVRTRLHVVDDERGLSLVVDVEARPFAAHLDPDFRPPICLEIDVRLVFGRGLLAQSGPGPIGIRDVLSRVIAALLIFGTPIRGPQIERIVRLFARLVVRLQPKGDTHETACSREGARGWRAGHFRLDDAVREVKTLNRSEHWRLDFLARRLGSCGDSKPS